MKLKENQIQDRIQYLRESTDFVSTVFDSLIGYAIIAADFDGNIIAYNKGAYQIYGYAPEEVIGKKEVSIFFPKEFIDEGGLEQIVSEVVGKGRFSYEGEKVKKDGARFPANILFTLTKDKGGHTVGFVEITEDLTERKQAEEATLQARERLEEELRSLDGLGHTPKTGVTARMYGVVPLLEGFPDAFQKLVGNYKEIMGLALEQQAYKVQHDISGRLSAIAETLGFYQAGPRDVVDLHTTALKEKTRQINPQMKKAFTGEGWIMVLELMGLLASFYRNRTHSVNLPTNHKKEKRDVDTINTKEADNE